jgi:segregation and condensation protein B
MSTAFTKRRFAFASVSLRHTHPLARRPSGIPWWIGGEEEVEDDPVAYIEPGKRDERIRRLETILLLSREALPSRKLAQYANLADGTEARTLVRRLNEIYDESGQAFRVEEVAGGFQLLSRPQFAPWLRRLREVPGEVRLSAPSMETLAVVAYRQPVQRAEVEAIRGVASGEILRQLMERDFVRICGRSEEIGRPYLYATTKRFLQLFGLRSLDELPRAEVMRRDEFPPSEVAPSRPVEEETEELAAPQEEVSQ